VEKINVIGKDFDILTMEAVTMKEGKEDNKVVEELSPGYMMHGSILRPAKVVVSKKKV
jgi:molecular chaperone GrpE